MIISVRLQEDLEASLEGVAERMRQSRNWLINQAVREFLERRQIEESRWQDTMESLRSIEAGQGIPEGEVHAGWRAGGSRMSTMRRLFSMTTPMTPGIEITWLLSVVPMGQGGANLQSRRDKSW